MIDTEKLLDGISIARRQLWLLLGGTLLVLGVVLLPYLLPLGGPDIVHPAELADPNGAFLRVGDESLYYTHFPGAGAPVILLHGFGGSTVTWIQTAPALADAGYDVYALDLLGFGLSEKGWNHDYSHPAQAARVIGLMDALGIERAVIVGHSMGGNVAAHLALSYPDRVDRLVLVSAAILGDGGDSFLPVPVEMLDLPLARRWARILVRQLVSPQFDDLLFSAAYQDGMLTAAVTVGYRRTLLTPEWDLGLMGITRDGANNALPAPVSAIDKPTLLVWGAEDTWVSPQDGVELEGLLPGAQRVEFERVGHLPMHEAPEEFTAAVLAFLAE